MDRDNFFLMYYLIFFFVLPNFCQANNFCRATAQQRQSNISRGSSLTPTKTSSWLSSSGLYAFGFYKRGNGYGVGVFVAGIPEKTVVWTAHRDNPPVSSDTTLLFTDAEGRLVLRTQGQDVDVVDFTRSASYASMLDTGNFVLCDSNGDVVWQSFQDPTDTLLPTQGLSTGMDIISSVSETDQSTGSFRLVMQSDGNLVQFPKEATEQSVRYASWASETNGSGDNVTLIFDEDGKLYIVNATGNIKNITGELYAARGTIKLMRIDSDGLFRVYSHDLSRSSSWSILWNSTSNRCDPKGLCGVNSFCFLNDVEPECTCIPGFVSVNQGNWTSGCERNFTEERCNSKVIKKYTLKELINSHWQDNSYSVMSRTSKDNCMQACLVDCNCEAALYQAGVCRKQRLPLRYGRRALADPTIAFVKVEEASQSSTDGISPAKEDKKEISKDIITIVSCLFFSLLVVIIAIFGIVYHRFRVQSYRRISQSGDIEFCKDLAPRSFSYAEIERMTDGFKEEIGRGSSGIVYKGTFMKYDGEKFVAAKQLQKVLSTSEKEFQTELKVIGKAHHRNLLRLLGYSIDGPNKVLVYEYMSDGSLADIIFTPEKQLNWVERMGIARDVARGILYLHDECETQIIHCDIKPQNILIEANGCAKISDFGLAKLMKPDESQTFTGIRGTRGYVAPEWHQNMPVTIKVDVYSFGIVLLEIICGRKHFDQSLPDDQVVLKEWVYQCFESGELSQLGVEEAEPNQLERIIKIALWCILDEPSLRPSMKKVLLMLEGTIDIPTPPNPNSIICTI